MPNQEKSVSELVSDSSENPNGEGESQKELENKIRQNLRKEYEQKSKEEVETRRKELEDSFEGKVQERINELENKRRLSNSEEDELDKLNLIKKHPDSKAWKRFIKESAIELLDEFKKEVSKEDYDEALEMVDEWSEELKIDKEKFKKEINELLPRVKTNSKRPTKLVKLAFKEWKREQSTKDRLKELEEKEKSFQEIGSRVVRQSAKTDDIKTAKDNDKWDSVLDKVFKDQAEISSKR